MAFHRFEIFSHIGFAEYMPRVFVMLVVIDTFDEYGTPVHEELVAPDFKFAESDPKRNNFGLFARLFDLNKKLVEMGCFRCPCLYLWNRGVEMNTGDRIDVDYFLPFRYSCTRRTFQLITHGDLSRLFRIFVYQG